ncbi:MAG: branched-chain amino acid ABC transporter permease [Actinobacteria bacterium]|nr:branched-chain amino acid ABC transporter permease [Actinomycetota bacterium]NDF41103.1 branched-chain amino acid ABC transporter permease [Actinomycetota bacterium]
MGERRVGRARLWLSSIGAAICILGFSQGTVKAAESEFTITASVQDQSVDGSTTSRAPVAGVTIVVTNQAGTEVTRGETGTDGTVALPVPAKDYYVVTLDVSTLPDGVSLINEEKFTAVIEKDAFTTNDKLVRFFTGASASSSTSLFDKILQRSVDGVRLGLIIAICSVGLSLIFGTTGLTNFAHGEMVTFGGLMAFWLNVIIGIPLLIGAPLVIVLGGLFGFLFNELIFGRLRKRGIGLISQLVVSVGLSIMLRNFYLYQFGGRTRPLDDFSLQVAKKFGPVSITMRDLTTAIISLVVLIAVAMFLQRSRTGKAIRAVSDNSALASSTGIDTQRIIRIVWIAGGALAALGGVFRGLDEQVGFEMGSGLIFLMFAGITLGGLGSAYGALVGGFFVGLFVELASLVVPAELKNAPALFILVVVLIVRPQGILGRKQRVG